MTIFKGKQIYGFTVWRWIKGHILGVACESYLQPPGYNGMLTVVCCQKMGHRSRHVSLHPNYLRSWGIGDNLV